MPTLPDASLQYINKFEYNIIRNSYYPPSAVNHSWYLPQCNFIIGNIYPCIAIGDITVYGIITGVITPSMAILRWYYFLYGYTQVILFPIWLYSGDIIPIWIYAGDIISIWLYSGDIIPYMAILRWYYSLYGYTQVILLPVWLYSGDMNLCEALSQVILTSVNLYHRWY